MSQQYIFTEEEFERSDFQAASFVAKYRRVSSLEALKEQLRGYSDTLKQQLYSIINRDYKDFINIATKLDGVDIRVEHIRKPLVDLRLDLATLHDGMTVSMEAIQDKLRRKAEVSNKRILLESILSCLDKLNTAEQIISASSSSPSSSSVTTSSSDKESSPMTRGDSSRSSRRDLIRSLHKYQSLQSPEQRMAAAVKRDLFECSELERAAYALTKAKELLDSVSGRVKESTTTTTGAGASTKGAVAAGKSSSPTSLASMHQSLGSRLTRLTDTLLNKIRSRFISILTAAGYSYSNGNVNGDIPSSIEATEGTKEDLGSISPDNCSFPAAAFLHCLRAFLVLSQGKMAELAVVETITKPLIRSLLTQGRIDGAAGRGSFGGLQEALLSITEQLSHSLAAPIALAEEAFKMSTGSEDADFYSPQASLSASFDLVIQAVWIPVTELLQERFPSMFSIAIATTFSRCYRACQAFRLSLKRLGSSSSHMRRLQSHPAVLAFNQRWRIDLYYQLRSQEICSRVDKGCDLSTSAGFMSNLSASIYSAKPPSSPAAAASAASVSLSLTAAELDAMNIELGIFQPHLPILKIFCCEMSTCLHPSVIIAPTTSRFIELSLRLLSRLEIHICLAADINTVSMSKQMLAAIQQQLISTNTANNSNSNLTNAEDSNSNSNSNNNNTATSNAAANTPAKKSGSQNPAVSTTAPSPSSQSKAPASVNLNVITTIEEMVLLAADIFSLEQWLSHSFGVVTKKRLDEVSALSLKSNGNGSDDSISDVIDKSISTQASKMAELRQAVWTKTCLLLAMDCKKNLAGVRVIAGKYRMTNKPPPETHSSYVETIFQPLRQFLDRHDSTVQKFSTKGSWDLEIVEEVSANFLSQVQSLMETVKQMDSALQRRSKLRPTGGGAGGQPSSSNALTDSDKISLQVLLDVKEFAGEISRLGLEPSKVVSYNLLLEEVSDTVRLAASGRDHDAQ